MYHFEIKNIFRSRLPLQLTLSQITKLSNQFNLSSVEIERWYERFILCYPYGYVSFQEFLIYLKQLNIYGQNQQYQLSKSLIKQLFYTLDINNDKQLNFEEFFQFNLLINQGTNEDKLKLILNLHDRQQNYYTQQKIVNILTNMFAFLNISQLSNGLSQRINTILINANMNNKKSKICWNTFCTYILNNSSSLQLLLSNSINNENFEEKLITPC
ncbi:unnamed protein product [Rotaria sp. Silwood1]|nr:unnamed protein product [Rotaria sp. Silwood1]CAF1180719.1 unnamed protein product [Rotaria sp. Silwood1]CAF1199804.1 unnamed protein product [Rotaria sp. Silwood1]CAF3456606.1 unnamed protein product [Rotaria sp. Silwood1]CAF3493959.1 unnamed protein product [Rotaria sp. Silwood1]